MGFGGKNLEYIADLISYGKAPLVTVIGPSGSGKTTLMINLAKLMKTQWFYFYNSVRANEYSELDPGVVIISGECLLRNPYEFLKYLITGRSGLAAAAESIVCEILRMKGLAAAQECKDVEVNSSVLEWARLELRPALHWIDSICSIRNGKIPYQSHVDLLRIPLLRCCINNNFVVFIDDLQLVPRIDFVSLIKSLRDTASVVTAIHPDQSLEKEVATMVSSAYIMCLTPRERWSASQLEYWRQMLKRNVGYKLEPSVGVYRCMVLQKEVEVKLPKRK